MHNRREHALAPKALVNLYLSGKLSSCRWMEAGLEMFGSAGRFIVHPCIDLEHASNEGSSIWEGLTAEAVDLESLRLAAFDRIDELLATLRGMTSRSSRTTGSREKERL